jgi:hypothetical protein
LTLATAASSFIDAAAAEHDGAGAVAAGAGFATVAVAAGLSVELEGAWSDDGEQAAVASANRPLSKKCVLVMTCPPLS